MITAQAVVETIARVLGTDARGLDPGGGPDTVEGWDSLKSIQVVMALEELVGRQLDLDGLASATSIRDLTRLVLESSTGNDECQVLRNPRTERAL